MLTAIDLLAGYAVGSNYAPPKLSTLNHFNGQGSVDKQEKMAETNLQYGGKDLGTSKLRRSSAGGEAFKLLLRSYNASKIWVDSLSRRYN